MAWVIRYIINWSIITQHESRRMDWQHSGGRYATVLISHFYPLGDVKKAYFMNFKMSQSLEGYQKHWISEIGSLNTYKG